MKEFTIELKKIDDRRSLVLWVTPEGNTKFVVCSYYNHEKPVGEQWSWGHYFTDLWEAVESVREDQKKLQKMYEILEEVCKDVRERYGQEDMCGLCQYDGAYMGTSGDWMNECPGFETDECFTMKNEIRRICRIELLPERDY